MMDEGKYATPRLMRISLPHPVTISQKPAEDDRLFEVYLLYPPDANGKPPDGEWIQKKLKPATESFATASRDVFSIVFNIRSGSEIPLNFLRVVPESKPDRRI